MRKRSQGLKWGKGGEGKGRGEKGKARGLAPWTPVLMNVWGAMPCEPLAGTQETNGFSMRKAPIVWPWLKSSL